MAFYSTRRAYPAKVAANKLKLFIKKHIVEVGLGQLRGGFVIAAPQKGSGHQAAVPGADLDSAKALGRQGIGGGSQQAALRRRGVTGVCVSLPLCSRVVGCIGGRRGQRGLRGRQEGKSDCRTWVLHCKSMAACGSLPGYALLPKGCRARRVVLMGVVGGWQGHPPRRPPTTTPINTKARGRGTEASLLPYC